MNKQEGIPVMWCGDVRRMYRRSWIHSAVGGFGAFVHSRRVKVQLDSMFE